MRTPPQFPQGPGKYPECLRWLFDAVQSLQPIAGPGEIVEQTSRGVRRRFAPGASAAGGHEVSRSLFVREIGIDAMWVSRPLAPGYNQNNYWSFGSADGSEHFFCLKPFELQNRYWWDEVAEEGLYNDRFGITGGASPQTGATTVQGVTTEAHDLDPLDTLGAGITARALHTQGPTPEPVVNQFITPPLVTRGWSTGATSYAGTTPIIGLRIPKGLLVCNEQGKVTWDAWDSFTLGDKPATLGSVVTWAIDDPAGPGGLVSTPKAGSYDVEFIDLNVDGRHWSDGQLSFEQQLMALTALNYSHLDNSKTYGLQVVSGSPQWVELP
jgi:hypothetical protein